MRKITLSLFLLTISLANYAQSSLSNAIRGDNGTTKHLVTIAENNRVVFNPAQAKNLLKLDANSDLQLVSTSKDKLGQVNYRFQQTYKGIPIENAMYNAQTTSGKIKAFSGIIITDFYGGKEKNVAITSAKAIDAAIKFVGASVYMWQDAEMEKDIKATSGAKATYAPTATLVWYSKDGQIDPRNLSLCYKVNVYAAQPLSNANYYIDAKTGSVVGKSDLIRNYDGDPSTVAGKVRTLYSGLRNVYCTFDGDSTYVLRDYTRGHGVMAYDRKGNDYTSPSPKFQYALPDRNAFDAYWGASETYDYYMNNFSRNSIDDNGYHLLNYVNEVGLYLLGGNAFWDGRAMHYGHIAGKKDGVTSIDVIGHEITHGVTENTCALQYLNETGAMNESLSDIMGKSVQFTARPDDLDWRLGNEMGWIIRDMSNPNAYSQPDTYKGNLWYSGTGDNGGVHYNSGVGNFFFYLLTEGGSGTNDKGNSYNVSGIGLAKADQIIYRTQTVYLFPTAVYADWRDAAVNAAIDIYGAGSEEVIQTMNAWYAVGIGSAALLKAPSLPAAQLVSMYPNPVTNVASAVKYTQQTAGNVTFKVYDRTGKIQQTYNTGTNIAGTYNYKLSRLPELSVGDYYITIEHNAVVTGRLKFVVLK